MDEAIMAQEDEEEVQNTVNNDLINEIKDAIPGFEDHIPSEQKKKEKSPKFKSILDLLSLQDNSNNKEEEYEIDDLNMIGISAPKKYNSKKSRK